MMNTKSLWTQLYRYALPGLIALFWTIQLLGPGQQDLAILVDGITEVIRFLSEILHFLMPERELCVIVTGVLLFLVFLMILFFAQNRRYIRLLISMLMLGYTIYLVLFGTIQITALFTVVFYCLETSYWFMSHLKPEGKEKAIASFVPFVFFIAGFGLILPDSKEPIDWYRIVDVAVGWIDDIKENFSESKPIQMQDFSITMSGFSGEDTSSFPSGYLGNNRDILMRLKIQYMLNGDGYLTGAVRNVYTSSGWKREFSGLDDFYTTLGQPEFIFDLCENLYYIREANLPVDPNTKVCRLNVNDLYYDMLETRSIFYPSLCFYCGTTENGTSTLLDDGKLELRDGKNAIYQTVGISLNYAHPVLNDYLSGQETEAPRDKTLYDEFMNIITKRLQISALMDSPEFLESLNQYEEVVDENYLVVPEQIPERVRNLAQDITKDCTNDYEKVMAIKKYLAKLKYSKTVEPLPEDRDFVDYFLFDLKEGYCMHFATAMAILCRCAGVPTRYIEGVRTDFKEQAESNYLIRGYMVHAWCDVYLEQYGWFRVEATPGYDENVMDFYQYQLSTERPEEVIEEDSMLEETKKEHQKQVTQRYVEYLTMIAIIAVIMILGIIIFFAFRSRRQYKRSNQKEKMKRLFIQCMKLLHYAKLAREDYETLQEYEQRLRKNALIESKQTVITYAFENYEKVIYGDSDVTDEMIQSMISLTLLIQDIVIEKKGRFLTYAFCVINHIVKK